MENGEGVGEVGLVERGVVVNAVSSLLLLLKPKPNYDGHKEPLDYSLNFPVGPNFKRSNIETGGD